MSKSRGMVEDSDCNVIKQLWLTGWSVTNIRDALIARYPDITRNVVLGVVARAGLVGQGGTHKKYNGRNFHNKKDETSTAVTIPIKTPKPVVQALDVVFIGPQNDIPALGYCRYTNDDVQSKAGYQMCGQPTGENGQPDVTCPWCEAHRSIVYQKANTRNAA